MLIAAVLMVGLLFTCTTYGPILRLENGSSRMFDSVVVVVRGDTSSIPSVQVDEVIEYRLRPKGETIFRLIKYVDDGHGDTLEVSRYFEGGYGGSLTVRLLRGEDATVSDSITNGWPFSLVPALRYRRIRRWVPAAR